MGAVLMSREFWSRCRAESGVGVKVWAVDVAESGL